MWQIQVIIKPNSLFPNDCGTADSDPVRALGRDIGNDWSWPMVDTPNIRAIWAAVFRLRLRHQRLNADDLQKAKTYLCPLFDSEMSDKGTLNGLPCISVRKLVSKPTGRSDDFG